MWQKKAAARMTQNEGLQLILLSLLFVYDEYFFILIKNKSEKMM